MQTKNARCHVYIYAPVVMQGAHDYHQELQAGKASGHLQLTVCRCPSISQHAIIARMKYTWGTSTESQSTLALQSTHQSHNSYEPV